MTCRHRSLVNYIIDKCDHSSTLDAKTKSDETLRVEESEVEINHVLGEGDNITFILRI